MASRLHFLNADERRLFSQVQGRTYANMFGMIERYIGAKTAELGRGQALTNQTAFEALVRMTDEELKHQELFRRLDVLMAQGMPPGYRLVPEADVVACAVLSKCDWAVLALTLHIERFTLVHYRSSIEPEDGLCPLWKDVFRFHWIEESQHAMLDELEWLREDARVDAAGREQGVNDLIELVAAVDGIVQAQASADADYFVAVVGRPLHRAEREAVHDTLLRSYRWQYIVSGVQEPRFGSVLQSMVTPTQMQRIQQALQPILDACGALIDAPLRPQPGGFCGGWITPELVGPFKGEPGSSGWYGAANPRGYLASRRLRAAGSTRITEPR